MRWRSRKRHHRRSLSRPLASCLALSLIAACPRAHAAINFDLSYVDTNSPEFARFKASIDHAVGGHFDDGFSAADAACLYRITGQSQYATLTALDWTVQNARDDTESASAGNSTSLET